MLLLALVDDLPSFVKADRVVDPAVLAIVGDKALRAADPIRFDQPVT